MKFPTRAVASAETSRTKFSNYISQPKRPAAESGWPRLIRSCSGIMDRWISNRWKGREPPSGCGCLWLRRVYHRLRRSHRNLKPSLVRADMKLFASFWILAVLLSSPGIMPGSSLASPQRQKNQQDQDQSQNQNQDQNKDQPSASAPTSPAPAPQTETPAPHDTLPSASPPKTSPPTPNPKNQNPLITNIKANKKPTAGSQSGKVVVRNGGAKADPPQLSPGISQQQPWHPRQKPTPLFPTAH